MNHKLFKTTIAAIILSAVSIANAQDKATLDLLVSKGVITQAEADKISKSAVAVTPKEKNTKSIKIIGMIQAQYENINSSVFSSNASTVNPSSKNDFILRHMYLGADADLGSGWSANIVADFSLSTYINSAYVSKKIDLDYINGRLDMGYKKVNFGYEENTAITSLGTVERSMTTDYWSAGVSNSKVGFGARHTGIFWNGKIVQVDGLNYGLAVTNSYNNSPTSKPANADNNLAYWANASYSTKIEDVAAKIGANFGYTNGAQVMSTAVYGDILGFNPYIAISAYGFEIWSDFILSQIGSGKGTVSTGYERATPMGANVSVEYKFDIGEFGKLGPIVRYSWIDTDGRGLLISDGVRNATNYSATAYYNSGQSIYIGANWYISGNAIKFQLGYEFAQLNGAAMGYTVGDTIADVNAVRAQMQIMF